MLAGCVALLALAAVAALRGMANARADPVLHATEVTLADWPAGSPPIRVALLSDIHIGNRAMTTSRLTRIVANVNAHNPDLILIAGDFTNGHDSSSLGTQAADLVAPLKALHASLGVVAVLGNHDHWVGSDSIGAALAQAGIVVLENAAVRRGPLAIVGIGDRFSGHDDIARASEAARQIGGAAVVLTHSPDLVPALPAAFTLVLAGHTHCGQVVIPGYGALLSRSPFQHFRRLYNPRYRCGVVRDPGRTTIVTGGLGSGTSPIRLRAFPDWWLITITPNPSST